MTGCNRLCATLLAIVLSACALPDIEAQPAVIVEPDAQSRLALQEAVSESLEGAEVTLAADALTDSSTLVLERLRPTSRESLEGESRSLDRPEHFQLVTQGEACILVHEESGARHMLADTRCRPE